MGRKFSITQRDLEHMLFDETAEPRALPFSLLEEITDDFSDKLIIGRGGFAVVYKGMLKNSIVAVKRSTTYMHEKEFEREVECLMMVKHRNIVRFMGYCSDTQGSMAKEKGKFIMADIRQRLLCFEYHPKGSLHEYITDTSGGLHWSYRYQIIKGICNGLHYLHQKNIVHLDLKPANILLGDNLEAKIADFGLSRCFDQMQSRVKTSKIGGTLGYLAPEFDNGEITYQFDIYSLGVIITEILTGRKGYQDVDKVVESWSNMLEKSRSDTQQKQVRVCAQIGIECTNFDPAKRPQIQHIISRLEETEIMDRYIETGLVASRQDINPDMLSDALYAFWCTYQRLNPDIKRCIEYCSIFPRGAKLRRDNLVCLWIAQGFVKTHCVTQDMEVVAEDYFQELLSCSFLQPQETSSDTGCFTIDDSVHYLLEKVAGDCFRIENAPSHIGEGWEGDVPQDIQHILVRYYDGELITQKVLGLKKLLTLIVYVVENVTPVGEKFIESICKRLPKLRVLAVAFSQEHDPIKRPYSFSIPISIFLLEHLHYFAVRTKAECTIILPSSLNKLHHVQLLDFGDGKISVVTLGSLINLRRIICGSDMVCPNSIGKMISLQALPCAFSVRNEPGYELKELRDMNKLQALSINGLENVQSKQEALEANLAAKERLTELKLQWGNGRGISCRLLEVQAEVFEGLCPPMGLPILRIMHYKGSRYPEWMQNGGLKYLQQLVFWSCGQPGGHAPQLSGGFPHLRVLKLFSCEWFALPSNMEHLTALKELVINRCMNIRLLPTLPLSLEEFSLGNCNDELMKSCQIARHQNWQKIKHIPEKKIG